MLGALLSETEEALLAAERRWLTSLRSLLAELGAGELSLSALDDSAQQLDQLFLLVVVGEFNSGKSSLLNAFLGRSVLPEGVTPTTARIHLLRWAERPEQEETRDGVVVVGEPLELLRRLHLVDTPGTNAVMREHEILTERFVPRADLVLFVTSSDRPFSESERSFLEQIRDWGKKVILVVNKADLLETSEQRDEVEAFVRSSAAELLQLDPPVYLVSAREALREMGDDGEAPRQGSLAALETYVRQTLDEGERLRLKLLNPIGVGLRLLGESQIEIDSQRQVVSEDLRSVRDLEGQLEAYREDMGRSFRLRLAEIENVIYAMEKRGQLFFDRNLRLSRVFDLLDRARVKRDFEAEVVGEGPQTVERKVGELAEWMVSSDLKQWQAISRHLDDRTRDVRERVVGGMGGMGGMGGVGGEFHDARHHVIEAVRSSADDVVAGYDRAAEAEEIAEAARRAVASSAALEVSAIGLGAVIASLATTSLVDVTGLVAAGLLATLGLLVVPAQKRRAKRELEEKMVLLRGRLSDALEGSFDGEFSRSTDRLRDTIAPYSRFVRTEQKKLEAIHGRLHEAAAEADRLQQEIEAI